MLNTLFLRSAAYITVQNQETREPSSRQALFYHLGCTTFAMIGDGPTSRASFVEAGRIEFLQFHKYVRSFSAHRNKPFTLFQTQRGI